VKREEEKGNKVFKFILIFIILFGILLRLKGFLANPSFWHDECAMAWNIKFKSYSELFGILRFLQVTPPFFSIATKFLTSIFGYSEMVFRFIPLLTGCLSIIGFYFLASKALKTRFSIITAVFLFVINQRLINFSFEFKPYGVDVFFTIICLLFFVNLDMEKLNKMKALIYGALLSIVPWFSFVSIFALTGGVLNLFFQNLKKKKGEFLFTFYSLLFPLLISALLYLKIYLLTNYTGTHMVSDWANYFITLNPLKFLFLLSESIKYLFAPVEYVLFALIMLIFGIIIYIREKSLFFNVAILTFISFIVTSFLKIYPFGDRIIIFLIPIYLLLMLKPIDTISLDKKWQSLMILAIILLTFYPQIIWAKSMIDTKSISRGEYPREMMKLLSENLKKDDVIFVNNLSNTEFAYYSSFYNLKNQVIQEPQNSDRIAVLNSIKKGQYCWFYIVYDNPELIFNWINKNTKIIKKIRISQLGNYLVYTYIN